MAIKLFDFSQHKPKLLLETHSLRFNVNAQAAPYLMPDAPGEVLVEPFLKASGDGNGACSALLSTEDDEIAVSKFFDKLVEHHRRDYSVQDNYMKWEVNEVSAGWMVRNYVGFEADQHTRINRLINLSLGGGRELWNAPTKMFSVTDGGRKQRTNNGKGPNFQLLIPITNKDVPHWLLALVVMNSRCNPEDDRYITRFSDGNTIFWYTVRQLGGVDYIAIQQNLHSYLSYWQTGRQRTEITELLREAERLGNFEVESLLALKRDVMNGTKLDLIEHHGYGGFPIFEVFKSLSIKEPAVPVGYDEGIQALPDAEDPYQNPWELPPVPRRNRGYARYNGPAFR